MPDLHGMAFVRTLILLDFLDVKRIVTYCG